MGFDFSDHQIFCSDDDWSIQLKCQQKFKLATENLFLKPSENYCKSLNMHFWFFESVIELMSTWIECTTSCIVSNHSTLIILCALVVWYFFFNNYTMYIDPSMN